jgi:hypothetical protein
MVIPRRIGSILFSTAIALQLLGCSGGRGPFELAVVCLSRPNDVVEFKAFMRGLAKPNHMEFFDRTEETREDRKVVGNRNAYVRSDDFMLNIGVLRADGMGVTVSENSGPGYPVILGFSEGSSSAEARRFADSVLSGLGIHWQTHVLPRAGEPTTSCQPSQKTDVKI